MKDLNKDQNLNLAENNRSAKLYNKYLKELVPNTNDIALLYRSVLSRPDKEIIDKFKQWENCMDFVLLRRALLRLSKNYDAFLHIKNNFIKNYAAACVVVYILGIGDRHLDNFLIHSSTASLVMIDFGYSFGAGLDIKIPELIPFRLTKCFR